MLVLTVSHRWTQTVVHIVDSCTIARFYGGLLSLHEADDDAISWLKMTATKALAK